MNGFPQLQYYDIVHLVAEGGTARVYWAIDKRSGFPVAIKELKLRHMTNTAIRDNFRNMETQLMLYARHPNIPNLVDFIDIPQTKQMFIVMEFVEGQNLEDYIYRQIGLLPEERALPIFLQILDAVGFLHKAVIPHLRIFNGVLHLDLKSNNVMLQQGDRIKLIDLGIASRISANSTSTGQGFGTPAYMPPEQSEKGNLGKYSDIFALGVVLFEMLTGHLPFNGSSITEIRAKIKNQPTPQMKDFYPIIGDELQTIVEKATAKNPLARYQTCEEFSDALEYYMKIKKMRDEKKHRRVVN